MIALLLGCLLSQPLSRKQNNRKRNAENLLIDNFRALGLHVGIHLSILRVVLKCFLSRKKPENILIVQFQREWSLKIKVAWVLSSITGRRGCWRCVLILGNGRECGNVCSLCFDFQAYGGTYQSIENAGVSNLIEIHHKQYLILKYLEVKFLDTSVFQPSCQVSEYEIKCY